MKKWFTKKSNILLTVFLAFVLFQQLPVIKNNLNRKDEQIARRVLKVLNPTESVTIDFPPENSRAIVIFWASWCAPCKIEMSRLRNSVESGAIPRNAIFAINPFESNIEIKKYFADNKFPFTFIEAPTLANELDVKVTPTTLFLDKGKISEMSSGMSIWGIWKAEFFL